MTRFHWPGFNSLGKLSAQETAELAERVSELTRAGLPLGEGLRALAGELSSRRLRHAIRTLADRLDAGMDLAQALPVVLPAHLRGLILAGLRSGRLAEMLEEYVDLERSQADLRRRVTLNLAYPIILLFMLTGLAIFANYLIVGNFVRLYQGFNSYLPNITILYLRSAWPMVCGLVLLLAVLLAIPISLAAGPRARWLWPILHGVPMVGPLLHWGHLSQFCRLMGLLLEQRVALPDALRLSADGLRDSDLAFGCRCVANDVDQGRVLYESMAAQPQFPPSLIPIVEWGQRAPALAEAFRAAAEMFEGRIRSQDSLVQALLMPFMLLLTLCIVGVGIIALLLPLVPLIIHLS